MLKKNKFSFIAYLSILIFTGCNKHCKEKDKSYYVISPEIRDIFNVYRKNNWWIYENSLETKRDCLIVESFINDYAEEENCDNFEYIKANLNSTSGDFTSWAIDCKSGTKESYCSFQPGNNVTFKGSILYFNEDSNSVFTSTNYNKKVTYIDTTIDGISYTNLIKNNESESAFSKSIGLIFTIIDGDTFYLKQYHIQ